MAEPIRPKCNNRVRYKDLSPKVKKIVATAVAVANQQSGVQVDRVKPLKNVNVCRTSDGMTNYDFQHTTIDDNDVTPNVTTTHSSDVYCYDDGQCSIKTRHTTTQEWPLCLSASSTTNSSARFKVKPNE